MKIARTALLAGTAGITILFGLEFAATVDRGAIDIADRHTAGDARSA